MSEQAKRDVAIIAATILGGYVRDVQSESLNDAVEWCVKAAGAIVAEVERTEPKQESK
jgi:hypothetical protein